MANHRRSTSIPQLRLAQPLPPLPLADMRPQISIQIPPYHDDPAEDEESGCLEEDEDPHPPEYEPMHDYLRSQHRATHLLQPLPSTIHIIAIPPPEEPYQDEPFVITIDPSQPPPPAYEELYVQDPHQTELRAWDGELDIESNPVEELCKFMMAMLLLALTVACVGTAFNWGRPW